MLFVIGRTTKATHDTETDGSRTPTGDDATEGFKWTQIQYDALDRQDLITHPDGNTIDYSYTGCGCAGNYSVTVRDERSRYRKMTYDFLGRLSEARELTSLLATYSRARYNYEERNLLTKIEHFNSDNDGGAKQERTFNYDGYARLLNQTTPEAGTVSYEYWPDDQIKKVTDARLLYAQFTYNSRNLLTDVDYSDSTPDAHYDYGEYGERTLMQEKNSSGVEIARTNYYYDTYKRLQTDSTHLRQPLSAQPLECYGSGVALVVFHTTHTFR